MKYIRTKDEIQALYIEEFTEEGKEYYRNCKIADTIEELCDKFVRVCQTNTKNDRHFAFVLDSKDSRFLIENEHIDYGAIWTDKGLIYVAKMNESGVLELL